MDNRFLPVLHNVEDDSEKEDYEEEEDDIQGKSVNYKTKYRNLKSKLKKIIYVSARLKIFTRVKFKYDCLFIFFLNRKTNATKRS